MRLAVALALVLLLPAAAQAHDGLRTGIPDGGKRLLVTYTCDLEVDDATGDVIGERCYARFNRYCNKRTGWCTKTAPWTRTGWSRTAFGYQSTLP